MMDLFSHYNPQHVVLYLALAMLLAWAVGWWLGARLRKRPGPRAGSKFDDASLALLGLLLAFTFGMSLNKHDNRRDMVVADANSIGDFYTCANLLKEPVRSELVGLIRQYVELRLSVAESAHPEVALDTAVLRSRNMRIQMRSLVGQAIKDGAPNASLLIAGLNRLNDAHALRLAAVRDVLPPEIVVLLFVSAVLSTVLVGREQGIVGRAEVAGTLAFIVLVTLTISVTLDLNQAQRGFVTVSQEPIRELISTLPR